MNRTQLAAGASVIAIAAVSVFLFQTTEFTQRAVLVPVGAPQVDTTGNQDAPTVTAPPVAEEQTAQQRINPAASPNPAKPEVKKDGNLAADALAGSAASAPYVASAPPMEMQRAKAAIGDIFTGGTDDIQIGAYHDEGRDKFQDIKTNPVKVAKEEPISTFSIDVDSASYSFVRGTLNQNLLPQKDAVRVEEMINYFPYAYEGPKDKSEPFKANVTVAPTPWNPQTKLLHIGIKGYQIEQTEKPHANLVFLIDTSGSMSEPDKLPLLQSSLKMLLDNLKADDTVSIVTYAGRAGIALEPTKIKDKIKIVNTIDNLGAGGSTAGAEGIRQAYQLAEQTFDKTGINRVILATDGDFNVGITDEGELKSFIERKRDTGIYLSVLGFGRGNYNDQMMQTLAQNGNAAYIDNINEARKTLVEEAGSTLFPIAKDVKIQVEFNPATVAEYRLIGYETRLLNREDFNNDKVDAGDIGAGHTVTALYEITPVGSGGQLIDNLRYGNKDAAAAKTDENKGGEYAFVKIRYKLPDSAASKLITTPVDSKAETKNPDTESAFAAAVAAFGQILRGDPFVKNFNYDDVIALANANKGPDPFGYRAEFINLVRLAKNAPALPSTGTRNLPVE